MNRCVSIFCVLALAACPAPSVDPCLENLSVCDVPDAGATVPDAGEFDWRDVRGAPYETVDLGEFEGRPWSLGSTTFALESRCDGGACDYEWRSDDGAVVTTRTNLQPAALGAIARDGTLASQFEVTTRDTCDNGSGTMNRFHGVWHLVSLENGASVTSVPNVFTSDFVDASFLGEGRHARLYTLPRGDCRENVMLLRSVSAPYASPPAFDALTSSDWLEDELPDGRFVINTDPLISVMSPVDATQREVLSSNAFMMQRTGGFVHVIEGYPNREVVSFEVASNSSRRTRLPFDEADWFTGAATGRYSVFSSYLRASGVTPFLLVDGRGEHAAAQVLVGVHERRRPLAIAWRASFAVFFDGETQEMTKLDLATGARTRLELPSALVRVVGDGHGVLVTTKNEAWAVTRDSVTRIAGRLEAVLDAQKVAQSQTVLVVTASESGGNAWLTAWHVPSGRIVRLTDSLYFNQLPVVAHCEAPGFVRVAGAPSESVSHDTKWLHFTEFVPGAASTQRLFLVPVDLSAPPRLFNETPQGSCGTPLVSRDGSRFWSPVRVDAKSVRAVMTVNAGR